MNPTMFGSAQRVSSGATALAERVARSVVEVRGDEAGFGAGILWGGPELVITNAHCVHRGVTPEVNAGGQWRSARLLAHDPRRDLALLAAPGVNGPLVESRTSESLRAGELVFATGHPHGVRDALTMGVIHGISRSERTNAVRWVISDVRLAPGNSGGPLVDAEGRFIGINSMVVNGLGVAVPADVVQQFVEGVLARRAA